MPTSVLLIAVFLVVVFFTVLSNSDEKAQRRPMFNPGAVLAGLLAYGLSAHFFAHDPEAADLVNAAGIGLALYLLFRARQIQAAFVRQKVEKIARRETGERRSRPADLRPRREQADIPPMPGAPEDFDTEEFLNGARAVRRRLCQAWQSGDCDSLEPLCMPNMLMQMIFAKLRGVQPFSTESSGLEIYPVSFTSSDKTDVGTVVFRGLGHDSSSGTYLPFAENWIFVRSREADALWKLEKVERLSPESPKQS